ncbi:hypothetical protein B484DRAFT_403402 [Ochromonadaceae sp. CCMP2298]|nr:hypothetical protein B484DRAFT_403402 [Ochromonadaceae sp. CCMP2298]
MADASEPPPMTPQQAEAAAEAAAEYLHDHYGEDYSIWDSAWLVLLNEGHLRPAFSVHERTDALIHLQIERKADLLLLVDGSGFEQDDLRSVLAAEIQEVGTTETHPYSYTEGLAEASPQSKTSAAAALPVKSDRVRAGQVKREIRDSPEVADEELADVLRTTESETFYYCAQK